MNPTNPFDSQTTAQAQLKKSRARLKFAVLAAFGVSLLVVVPMLVQGCKREEAPPAQPEVTNAPVAEVDTNLPPIEPVHSNIVSIPPINIPMATNAPVIVTPTATGTGEYVVAKGDSFYSIAKKSGTSIKAISDANPGVDSKKLKVGQKLNVPAGTAPTASSATAEPAAAAATGEAVYKVKSGDTLTRIAKSHGTTVKTIKSINGLTTDQIKVGQKLKLPVKEAAASAPAPVVEAAPVLTPMPTLPAPTTPTK